MVQEMGAEVFLDLKFHDIPNTVAKAIEVVARLKPYMLTLHTMGGVSMMEAAVRTRTSTFETSGCRSPLLLGVTILTHLDRPQINSLGIMRSVRRQVVFLSKLAEKSGLNGVIASPREVAHIRKAVKEDFVIVTPGVRPLWAAKNDQRRIATPRDAIASGADYVVMGRPILKSKNPPEAAQRILKEIESQGKDATE
jgi:orotidine-5'-phosphate decarboxylase